MDYLKKIITDFELHSVEVIKDCFEHGVSANENINGKPLIYSLVNMYTRGPLFKQCIKAFVDHGLEFNNKILLAVLLDDADLLDDHLTNNSTALQKTYSFDCTFTPLYEASLLHICAEYNHLAWQKSLLSMALILTLRQVLTSMGLEDILQSFIR